jgi:hypothetical protein
MSIDWLYLGAFGLLLWTALSARVTLWLAKRFFGEPDAMTLEPGHQVFPSGELPEAQPLQELTPPFFSAPPPLPAALRKAGHR